MRPGELLIYTDILDNRNEVIFIKRSNEAPTLFVQFRERRIWIRESQAESTGRMAETDKQEKKKGGWVIGSKEWEKHLAENKRRKR